MMPGFLARAESVMRALGPRGALHLRTSRLSGRKFHELAERLSGLQATTGCWLIVNDRVDVAASTGARGIQLASHSLRVQEARIVAPSIPVGTSIHSVEEAREAEAEGASWCVAGTVFDTPSHEGRRPARVEFIELVAAAVRIPVIAIGGVTPGDVGALIDAGAHGVATIRGAAWERTATMHEANAMMETRLEVHPASDSVEPVTRYISAYDAHGGLGRDDHSDGERSATRGGPE